MRSPLCEYFTQRAALPMGTIKETRPHSLDQIGGERLPTESVPTIARYRRDLGFNFTAPLARPDKRDSRPIPSPERVDHDELGAPSDLHFLQQVVRLDQVG